jgi:Flavin containing amine oxidoreductase
MSAAWAIASCRPEVAVLRFRGISWREKASLARLIPFQLRVAASMRFFDLASAAAVDSRSLEAVVGPAVNRYFTSAIAEVFCAYAPAEVSLPFGVLGSRYPLRRAWILKGGVGALTGELGRRVEARCGTAVRRVRPEGHGVAAETGDGESLRARAAILATRAHEVLEMWPEAPEPTRRFLGAQAYSGGFGVFLRTKAPIRHVDPSGRDLFMDIVPEGQGTEALLAAVYLNEMASDGGLFGLAAYPDVAAASSDDAALATRLEAEFAELNPAMRPDVTARRTMRWPVFVPSYPTGRARQLAAFRAGFAPSPVQLAGDYLYGPMMEAAVQAGQEAAGRASRYLNAGS